MRKYQVISADGHMEVPIEWEKYVPAKYKEHAPKLVRRDDGSEEVIGEVKPGSYFGELAPLFGLPRSATAQATEPTTVTGLPLQEFRDRLSGGSLAPPLAGAAVGTSLFGDPPAQH